MNELSVNVIKALLNEAAMVHTSRDRLLEIQHAFCDNTYRADKDNEYYHTELADGNVLSGVISTLFRDAITSGRRDYLPSLLPVFVAICGPRGEGRYNHSLAAYKEI